MIFRETQQVVQYNLIVVKWGTLYSAEHVKNLYEGAKRYTTVPFNFYVFTDDATDLPRDKGWIFIKLPEYNVPRNRGWWYKMEIFNTANKLQGKNLYIDLDVIILKDLRIFWEHILGPALHICRDFNRQFIPSHQACNSSVLGWTNDSFDSVFRKFTLRMHENMNRFRGDQDYLQANAFPRVFWPDDLAMSWKWECWRGGKIATGKYKLEKLETRIKPETRILVFHGQPKPEECEDAKMIELWKGTLKHT